MNKIMFDASATDFAASTDSVIKANAYVRGALFIGALNGAVPKGARVLDFGCGPGRIALLAAEAGYSVDGVDSSTGMIAVAKAQAVAGRTVSFRDCDGIGDDLATGEYDAVLCSSVVEYVPAADRLLANLGRALKPGGRLAISYCNKRSLWRAYARAAYRDKPHYTAQINIWTWGEFKSRLERVGFAGVSKPVFLEAAPFDARGLFRVSASPLIGTLGFVTAAKRFT